MMNFNTREQARIIAVNGLKWAALKAVSRATKAIIVKVALFALRIPDLESRGIYEKDGRFYDADRNVVEDTNLIHRYEKALYRKSEIATITQVALWVIIPVLVQKTVSYDQITTFSPKRFAMFSLSALAIGYLYQTAFTRVCETERVNSLRKYKVMDAILLPAVAWVPQVVFMGALYASGIKDTNWKIRLSARGVTEWVTRIRIPEIIV